MITVPKQTEYDEGARVFAAMSEGLKSASDTLRGVIFRPGHFRQADELEAAVEEYLYRRREILQIFSEAAARIGEIVQLTGEIYIETEQQRADGNGNLEGRIKTATDKLAELHRRYDALSHAPSGGYGRPLDPTSGSGGIRRFPLGIGPAVVPQPGAPTNFPLGIGPAVIPPSGGATIFPLGIGPARKTVPQG